MAVLKTVAQTKDSVSAILSNVDLNNIGNLNGALERAARNLCQNADIPEASGRQSITLYDSVYDYPCDTRIFGTAVNDIKPQGITRSTSDFVYKRPGQQFDRTKGWLPNGTQIAFEYRNGVPIIRIDSTIPKPSINIDTMSSTTGWTLGGSASALAQDATVFYQYPASLRFTLTGSSSGTLTKTLTNSLSLSTYNNIGVAFLAIRMADTATASNLTSVTLKFGSSASNYATVTNTTGFISVWTTGEWLLVPFDFSTATNTGTPNWSAMNYIQVVINHTGTFSNFWCGGLFIALPSPAIILYQSAAIFIPSGSTTPLTTITSDTDTILLNNAAYSIYEYEAALSVLQQTGGARADSATANINSILYGDDKKPGLYKQFQGDNPSQELRTVGSWYGDNQGYINR